MSDEELPVETPVTESESAQSVPTEKAPVQTPPVQTPWWVSDSQTSSSTLPPLLPTKRVLQVTWYMALAMSLIAGLVGALVGKVAFDNSPHLVTSNKVIERSPNSIAGICARDG